MFLESSVRSCSVPKPSLDIDDDGKEEEVDLANSVFRHRLAENDDANNENSSKKLDKVIKRAISNVKEMMSIKLFKLLSLLWIVSIALMSAFQLVSSTNYFTNTSTLIDLMLNANAQIAYFARINSYLLDAQYLAGGYYTPNEFVNLTSIITELNSTTNDVIANSKLLADSSYLDIIGRQNEQYRFYDFMSIKSNNFSSFFMLGFDHHIDMVCFSDKDLILGHESDPTARTREQGGRPG